MKAMLNCTNSACEKLSHRLSPCNSASSCASDQRATTAAGGKSDMNHPSLEPWPCR